MKIYRKEIAILVISIFFSSSLYSPGYAAPQKQRSGDPYARYSDDQLLEMAQKDYKTAVKYAVKLGVIKSEEEVFKLFGDLKGSGAITKRERAALEKRKIDFKPSHFLGATRTKALKAKGFDIDKVAMEEVKNAGKLLKSLSYFNLDKDTGDMVFYKKIMSILSALVIRSAHAQTSRMNSRLSSSTSASSTVVTTTDPYTTSGTYRMDDEDLSSLEDMYDQPSVADFWDKSNAVQQKGYQTHSSEIKSKKATAMLCIAGGALLIYWGYKKIQAGDTQMGFMLIAAGAALILYGLKLLGDAAAMEDEEESQKNRNEQIEKSRQDMLDREQERKDAKEKIIKYRQRTKQIREREEAERRRRLQDAASGTR